MYTKARIKGTPKQTLLSFIVGLIVMVCLIINMLVFCLGNFEVISSVRCIHYPVCRGCEK